MFDDVHTASDEGLVAAIENLPPPRPLRQRRLAAIAELVRRRCDDDDDETAHWSCDTWDFAAAEVAAALKVGHARASRQMQLAESLSQQRRGSPSCSSRAGRARVVTAIAWRTHLVTGTPMPWPRSMPPRRGRPPAGMPCRAYKLEQAVDTWIDRYDPGASPYSCQRHQP